jgi:hypothetical protein
VVAKPIVTTPSALAKTPRKLADQENNQIIEWKKDLREEYLLEE